MGSGNSKKLSLTWSTIFKEIITTLYFQDHLNKHFLQISKLLIIFKNHISLEILNLLILFAKKYSFVKLKKLQTNFTTLDLYNYYINRTKNYFNSKLTLIIGLNTRYESCSLNLKIKKQHVKTLMLNSLLDLTFPTSYLGLTF